MKCCVCGSDASRVMYLGLPMWLCNNEGCSIVWGFWSWLPTLWFNGAFVKYDGWYLPALWNWLFGKLDEERGMK
jgi:hypothetical protein